MNAIPPAPGFWYGLGGKLVTLVTHLLADWQVEGTQHMPKKGPLLVVCNHFSFIDPPLLVGCMPRVITFVAKAELWDSAGSRLFCKANGMMPIRRGEPDLSALRGVLRVLEEGRAVGFFPEGTRGRDPVKTLKEAQAGIALLARLSGAPILPVGVYGTEVIDSPAAIRRLALKRPSFRIRVGEPFHLPPKPSVKTAQDHTGDTGFIMAHIARLLPERYWGYYADHVRRLTAETERVALRPAP